MIKRIITSFCTILISVAVLSCNDSSTSPEENKNGYEGYSLVWQDEFNSGSLDVTKWNFETGTGVNGDFGTGQIDIATDRVENVSTVSDIADADGRCLSITTRRENYQNRYYTSGRINTKNKGEWGPGHKIEARVKPEGVKHKGQGFAFWMMPNEIPPGENHLMWPQGGEIDIMEYVGAIPFHNLGSVHYAFSWENNQWQSWNHGHKGAYYSYETSQAPANSPGYGNYPPSAEDINAGSADFHIYGIDWFEDRMEFYVDGNVYHINYFNDGDAFDNGIPDGQDEENAKSINSKRVILSEYSHHFTEWQPFSHEFYIILSAGVGGDDNRTYGGAIVPEATFPCNVYIDWVRVYKQN